MWAFPPIWENIQSRLICLTPEVCAFITYCLFDFLTFTITGCLQIFPLIYDLTLLGIRSLIDILYASRETTNDGSYPSQREILAIELMSQAERAYNYVHTGNTKCLTSTSMGNTWLSPSVIHDGMPCINKSVIKLSLNGEASRVNVQSSKWPVSPDLHVPYLSSKASILFYLGPYSWNVSDSSIISFCIFAHQIAARIPCLSAFSRYGALRI